MVAACRLEGEAGIGQRRVLTLEDGTVTISRLEALDPRTRTLTYRILETRLPLQDYTSTMVVVPRGADRCEVTWTSHFRPRDASPEEAPRSRAAESAFRRALSMTCPGHVRDMSCRWPPSAPSTRRAPRGRSVQSRSSAGR